MQHGRYANVSIFPTLCASSPALSPVCDPTYLAGAMLSTSATGTSTNNFTPQWSGAIWLGCHCQERAGGECATLRGDVNLHPGPHLSDSRRTVCFKLRDTGKVLSKTSECAQLRSASGGLPTSHPAVTALRPKPQTRPPVTCVRI
jgi:hypothetical protein